MKLIAPNKDETPAKCKLKIAKSTEPPEWDWIDANGGYHNSYLFILNVIYTLGK